MIITHEIDFADFEPWTDKALDTYETIISEGYGDAMSELIEELYPEGISETDLNDILRFDSENLLEALGIAPEDEED